MTDTTSNDNAVPSEPRKATRQEAWRERNPQKYWAHSALRSGLRRGLVQRQLCEECGCAESEAHHFDYARPLEVKWLCRVHHKQVHAAEKREQAA